jgi:hypothetical protein
MQVTITFLFVELKYIPLIINTDLWFFPSTFGVEGFVLRLVYKRELYYEKGKKLGKKRTREDHDQLKLSNIDFFNELCYYSASSLHLNLEIDLSVLKCVYIGTSDRVYWRELLIQKMLITKTSFTLVRQ